MPALLFYTRCDAEGAAGGAGAGAFTATAAGAAGAAAATAAGVAAGAAAAAAAGKAAAATAAAAGAGSAAAGRVGKAAAGAAAMTAAASAAAPTLPSGASAVLTPAEFARVCVCAALQTGAAAKGMLPLRFRPLDMATDPPRPGMLLAIDAEFVALTPLSDVRAIEGELPLGGSASKAARLCLARVSVLRGEGVMSGVPCIDDHVKAVEPVFDYLTRFSGVSRGDLDPQSSRHYLTTLKHAYLKLRYLADCGCIFIGHGLKKDFRIINLTLPASQQIDTVELFSYRRQRKLSLRYLASYLLGINIQGTTHDAIEDARTALLLYRKYQELVAAGTFDSKLTEVYQWGQAYGWEAVTLDAQGRPVPPTAALTAAPIPALG
ncbi:hypothetical protein FOA52_014972 [Chlamydomonas sp. UWO 241]|nr:hypothetical protein FOA52_014972 [Chlamydomonas sp. UWO 241]